jgi:eukaryotic-like serine/threonine-protein kinase
MGELLDQVVLKAPLQLADKMAADAAAKERANAAIVLMELGRDAVVWPLLAAAPDRRLRTYLIHRFGPAGVDPRLLIAHIEADREPSVRQAILLGLAGYEPRAITPRDRRDLCRTLHTIYRVDPDPGIHSAILALLRRWGDLEELRDIDRQQTGPGPAQGQGWFTNRQGHTMAVIPGPGEAVIYEENGRPHQIVIPRRFAVSTKEVTAGQYREYLRARGLALFGPAEDDRPMDSVTWFQAAAYQMCYPPIDQIGPGMRLPADYLQRTGYRLPTEAEWACACQAGATTDRFYGSEDDLLNYYGWTTYNANGHSWPVGRLAPNDFGLFDVIGNVYEWCDGPARSFDIAQPKQAMVDNAGELIITGDKNHVLRGGAFDSRIGFLTTRYRNLNTPLLKSTSVGFRIARTCK